MVTYAYTGTLTDIGLGNLGGWLPEMTVRPKVSAYGPDGLVSDIRVPVTLAGDAFTMNLIPSGELTPVGGGAPGVNYVIEVGRYELADDLTKIWHGTEAWEFTAVVGGGNIGEMNGGSLLAFFIGPPWPSLPSPRGMYFELTTPNRIGLKE